jgi:hypothetical protein
MVMVAIANVLLKATTIAKEHQEMKIPAIQSTSAVMDSKKEMKNAMTMITLAETVAMLTAT